MMTKRSARAALSLMLAMLAWSVPGRAERLPEGLKPAAYWSFNDCGTTDPEEGKDRHTIRDISSQAYHLTLKGPLCVSGRYGEGVWFDGVDDVAETAGGVLNFTDQLTISAWVRPDRLAGIQNIVNKWYAMDSYALSLHEDRFTFTVASESGGAWGTTVDVEARRPAHVGVWHHVAGVFDAASSVAEIWIDGRLSARIETDMDSLQPSDRPVAVGSHPVWSAFRGSIDEVGLYNAALTPNQIWSLAGRRKRVYHGADSSTSPERNEYPNGPENGYDFYIGRLGKGLGTCRVREFKGRDLLSRKQDEPECCFATEEKDQCPAQEAAKCKCLFQYEAAAIARPERTYAYWWLWGPGNRGSRDPFSYGLRQAEQLLRQRRKYEHLIGGITLYGDVERSLFAPGSEGWAVCRDPENPSDVDQAACRDNRAVLDGFLGGIRDAGYVPGVYTRPNIWVELFDESYVPRTSAGARLPFALWLTGCDTTKGVDKQRSSDEVARKVGRVLRTVLGGMRAVLWQHHYDDPDLDATTQDPSRVFFPRKGLPGEPYEPSCP